MRPAATHTKSVKFVTKAECELSGEMREMFTTRERSVIPLHLYLTVACSITCTGSETNFLAHKYRSVFSCSSSSPSYWNNKHGIIFAENGESDFRKSP